MEKSRKFHSGIFWLELIVLFLLNSCFNLNERVNSCYVENKCNIAVLNCMLNYQAVTAGKSDYPFIACLYIQESCKRYCRICEKKQVSMKGKQTVCFTNRGRTLAEFKPEDFKNPFEEEK